REGPSVARRALVTGATGFVGGRLAAALAERGWEVRCLVRDRSRAQRLADRGFEIHEADALDAQALRGAGAGVDVAYYLIHAMGRGTARGGFEEREQRGARNFAEMAKREGVARDIYLGGLGDRPQSAHLRSRHRTAEILSALGPPLTYFRAGMIVGAGSESYRTLRYLVQRLPAMIGPAWLKTPTQAIAIDDVIAYLVAAPDVPASAGREIQIAGPDVHTYGEMLDLMADALGVRRRPRLPVPLITPRLSSLWIGLVTPVDAGIARPLVEGLATPTIVTDHSGGELFDIHPMPLMDALRTALAEDHDAPARAR
ncbi:MAG: NAD(P)H-binding protein, partial [Conexibacter sp.]